MDPGMSGSATVIVATETCLTMVVCMALGAFLASWWRRRRREPAGREVLAARAMTHDEERGLAALEAALPARRVLFGLPAIDLVSITDEPRDEGLRALAARARIPYVVLDAERRAAMAVVERHPHGLDPYEADAVERLLEEAGIAVHRRDPSRDWTDEAGRVASAAESPGTPSAPVEGIPA